MVYVRRSQIGNRKVTLILLCLLLLLFFITEDGTKALHMHVNALPLNYTSNPGICFLLKKDLISLGCFSASVMYI